MKLALIASSLYALKKMILICENYAAEFQIMCNPDKSRGTPSVFLCGKQIHAVYSEYHLGNSVSTIYTIETLAPF